MTEDAKGEVLSEAVNDALIRLGYGIAGAFMIIDATPESLAAAINEALRQAGWGILPMSYFIFARKLPSVSPRQVVEATIAEHVVADK